MNLKIMSDKYKKMTVMKAASVCMSAVLLSGTAYVGINPSQIVYAQDDISSEYGESVLKSAEMLDCLGIMTAPTGEDGLGESVSRGEFIGIVGKILFNGLNLKKTKCFDDVSENTSNSEYICAALKAGIINGAGDNKFYPERQITLNEAQKILVGVLGYDIMIDKTADIESQVREIAAKIGLSTNIGIKNPDGLTKGDVINLVYNCLDIPILNAISYKNDGEFSSGTVEKNKDKTVLTEYMKIEKAEGVVDSDSDTNIYNSIDDGLEKNQIKLNGLICTTDGGDYLGKYVTAYIKKEANQNDYTALYVSVDSRNRTVEISDEDLSGMTSDGALSAYDKDGKKKDYKLSANASVLYNGRFIGKLGTSDISKDDFNVSNGSIELIDNDGGAYDIVKIVQYNNVFVNAINTADEKITDYYTDSVYDLSGDNDKTVYIYKNGAETGFSSIKKEQVLSLAESKDKSLLKVYISDSVISGTVSEKNENDVKINDTEYKISTIYSKYTDDKNKKALNITSGTKGKFYTDFMGKISAYKNTDTKYYAYLVGIVTTDVFESNGKAKLYTVNGEMAEFEFADKVKYINNGVSKTVDITQLKKLVEPMQAVVIDTNSDEKITSIETAVSSADVKSGVFSKNAAKNKMQYNISVLNARYRISDDTYMLVVPDADKISDVYNEKYYRTVNSFSNGASYTAEIYDIDELHNAGLVVIYTDKTVSDLGLRYAKNMIIEGHSEQLDDDGMVTDVIDGYNSKKATQIPLDDKDAMGNDEYAAWKDLNTNAGNLKFGDVVQYNTTTTGEFGMFRVLFRLADKNEYEEKWSNGSVITENTTNADVYTAYAKITAIGEKQVLFKSSTGSTKLGTISSSTEIYIVDVPKKKIETATYGEVSIGDDAFIIITPDGTKAIYVYRR